MKRLLKWGIGLGVIALAVASIVEAAKNKKDQDKKEEAAPIAKPDEKIGYTFKDDTDMQAFTQLWQQRQAIIVRMTVLKSYWDEEEVALANLNAKIATDYKLDPTKNYSLDTQRRVLIERELPMQTAPATPAAQPAASAQPTPAN